MQPMNDILVKTGNSDCEEVRLAMSQFKYFDGIDAVNEKEGSIIGKIMKYKENDIVMDESNGIQSHVYFVLSGQCQLIENMDVIINKHSGNAFFKLNNASASPTSRQTSEHTSKSRLISNSIALSEEEARQKKEYESRNVAPKSVVSPDNVETVFLQVCLFNPGATFGVGENMKNRRIVCLENTECLVLPKQWLLQNNRANIWGRIKHFLDKRIPTTEQLFKDFVANRKWNDWKATIVKKILESSKTVNNTRLHDVPCSIRILGDYPSI